MKIKIKTLIRQRILQKSGRKYLISCFMLLESKVSRFPRFFGSDKFLIFFEFGTIGSFNGESKLYGKKQLILLIEEGAENFRFWLENPSRFNNFQLGFSLSP